MIFRVIQVSLSESESPEHNSVSNCSVNSENKGRSSLLKAMQRLHSSIRYWGVNLRTNVISGFRMPIAIWNRRRSLENATYKLVTYLVDWNVNVNSFLTICGVCLIYKIFSVPKRVFNFNSVQYKVRLLASKFRAKFDLLLREHLCVI